MTDTNTLRWQSFFLPKRGNSQEEYEDALTVDPVAGRFAIADGASESAFAGAWAKVVAEAFVATPGPWASWLPAARARWHAKFQHQEMPWYLEAKFEQGAFATLLGIAMGQAGHGRPRRWRAWAVGDCCLFHVRHGSLLRAFPVTRSVDFGNQPALLGSRAKAIAIKRSRMRGNWRDHDVLLLTSDALAHWCLLETEAGRHPWELLFGVQTDKDFSDVIEVLRDRKTLRNDDVTLLTIR